MALRRIKPNDYPMIESWYRKRKLTPPPWQDLSETGWIADDRVAGWLLCTNSSVAIIEGLISNPDSLASNRKESMLKLSGFLVDTALLLGYSKVIAVSKHPSVDKVAKQLGFRETDLTFYILNDDEEDERFMGTYLMDNRDLLDDE
jgi:hypothetical protein